MLNSEIFGARELRGAFFAADEGGNGGNSEALPAETRVSEREAEAARRAEEAEARASRAERNLMARDIAAELGLPHGASKFIGGQSEEEMRASAEELRGLGVGSAASPPIRPSGTFPEGKELRTEARIGSASAPARAVELPVDDQIAAAYKAGNQAEAIRLKRMKAGLGVKQG